MFIEIDLGTHYDKKERSIMMKKKLTEHGCYVWFTNERGFTEFGFAGETEHTHRYYPRGVYARDNGGELYQAACELAEELDIVKTEKI